MAEKRRWTANWLRTRNMWLRAGVFIGVASAIMAATARSGAQPTGARRLAEAEIFLELNDTDGDLGLHASIDGEAWTQLKIEGPGESPLLDVFSRGKLSTQGMTQLAFESAEPPFDELLPAVFFRRFRAGRYEITARALNGTELRGVAVLSHVLAAAPDNILVSGLPAAENCDAPLPRVHPPVRIEWDLVTTSHPTLGEQGQVAIALYQVFVERVGVKLSVDLPPTATSIEVPELITSVGKEFKFEIIARTTRGNNTAVESCFELF